MPTESDGGNARPPDPANSSPPTSNRGRGRRARQRSNKKSKGKTGRPSKSTPPPGAKSELGNNYYEIPGVDPNLPSFTEVTRSIITHFVSENDNAVDYMDVIDQTVFKLPDNPKPTAYAATATEPEKFEWESKFKDWAKREFDRNKNNGKLYALLHRQCTEQFQQAVREHPKWSTASTSKDPMDLLTIINYVMANGGNTDVDPVMERVNANIALYKLLQQDQDTARYYSKFMNLAHYAEAAGCAVGPSVESVLKILADDGVTTPTIAEIKKTAKEETEKELAMLFFLHSDKKRYGNLVAHAANSRLTSGGAQTFPQTMASALSLLNNGQQLYTPPTPRNTPRTTELGASFLAEGEPFDHGGRGRRGGRGGSGRGRGGPGRGRGGRGHGRDYEEQAHINDEDDEEHINDNNSESDQGYSSIRSVAQIRRKPTSRPGVDVDTTAAEQLFLLANKSHYTLVMKRHPTDGLPVTWIILDTGSTANIFCNRKLLTRIHRAKGTLKVRCNAGVVELTMKGYFGDFPEPVWFNPHGIANIMSFHKVSRHYPVEYNNSLQDRFIVHVNRKKMYFIPTSKGLYHADLDDYKAMTFLETVKGQKAKHTKRAVMRAAEARRLQNIIGRPDDRRFAEIVNKNWLRGSTVTGEDIRVAANIYGPNLGSLKGKTTSRNNSHVRTDIGPIPRHIIEFYSDVVLAIDIMFVNKMPFLLTISRHIKFGTVERLSNRQIGTIKKSLKRVMKIYSRRNFQVKVILGDPEFDPLKNKFPGVQVDTCGADKHIPEIERFVRTVKDRTRSDYNMLPYRRLPKIMLEHLVRNAVFWLNAFPARDGVSNDLSPSYIVTGRHVTKDLHAQEEFGSYVQTHEEHSNDMRPRVMGGICLGPTGSAQGTHYFMSVATGARVTRENWTPLPLPQDVIDAVSARGLQQGMPATLTFADRHGKELLDEDDEVDDDHDSDYGSDDDSDHYSSDSGSYDSDSGVSWYESDSDESDDESYHPGSDEDDDSDTDLDDDTYNPDSDSDDGSDASTDPGDDDDDDPPPRSAAIPAGVNERQAPVQLLTPQQTDQLQQQLQTHQQQFPDESTGVGNRATNTGVGSANKHTVGAGNTGVGGGNTGVRFNAGQDGNDHDSEDEQDFGHDDNDGDDGDYDGDGDENDAGNDDDEDEASQNTDNSNQNIDDTIQEMQQDILEGQQLVDQQAIDAEMDQRFGTREHGINLRRRRLPTTHAPKGKKPSTAEVHQVHIQVPHRDNPVPPLKQMKRLFRQEVAFLTEQMSAKKGLKVFGNKGAEAVVKEMHQIHYRNVLDPKYPHELTQQQRRDALKYLMFLKEKRCGKIKARGCADGRRQRLYKTKEETAAPTVRTESFVITCAIDAMEGRKVMTIDIPGAFMQADTDELIHVKFEGEVAELLTQVDPALYTKYLKKEGKKKKPVIYARLNKNLYGTLQGALCWWRNLSSFLVDELGFEMNPYDNCVVNKMINGKQCTIIWHVDDLKVSHMEQEVLEEILKKLSERYGKEAPLTVQRGDVHEYLGVTIDFSKKGKVQFSMNDYVDRLLEEVPEDMNGVATSPAANHLFQVKGSPDLLDDEKAEMFHHLTAKLLYLCKRIRGDLMTAVAFLTTRVSKPDKDDYNKLARCIKYLRATKYMPLTIEMENKFVMQWWVDASFAVHKDMKSHTGAVLTMGKGAIIAISTKQKINTDSSTVAELVGVHDALPMIMWCRYFISSQGYHIDDNVIHQDNQSAMLLERNGRRSCGKKTRALDIRYFSVTDKIKNKLLRVLHCPTAEMIGDFLTKPLQGAQFRKFRDLIMNYSDGGS